MSTTAENNKRIIKNSLLLYFRMFLTMAVSLYTSRVVLNILGVEDYGIYNVVGGVVTMLSFLNNSLSGASSRFLTVELGKKEDGNLKQMFSTILCIHFILAIIIVLLGETVGLWFVLNKLVIPEGRMTAALWVYHCSILTAVVSVVSVPYSSLFIAHERMNAFAYISIVEVSLKLLIVWCLSLFPFDKLIIYAIFYLIVQFFIRILYHSYCTKKFQESRTLPVFNPKQIKEIFIYATWTMNGYLAILGCTQGINILLNLFFGPVVNAARGIAVQVQHATTVFVHNFQLATRPQIIKSYVANDLKYMHTMIIASSKYGFYLMLLISFPILLCIHSILNLWLGIVPDYTYNFVYIMLLIGIIQPFSYSLVTGIHATGKIRKFQIFEGTSLLTVVPISYILLKTCNISPEMVMIISLFVEIVTQGIRIWIVLPQIQMKYVEYFEKLMIPSLMMLFVVLLPLILVKIPENISVLSLFGCLLIAMLYIIICIFILGLNKVERNTICQYMKKYSCQRLQK